MKKLEDDDEMLTRYQDALNNMINDMYAKGASDDQVMTLFKTAAGDIAATTVERVEKREGRKLSAEEIQEICDAANAAIVEPLKMV